jgi:hypothetical protein
LLENLEFFSINNIEMPNLAINHAVLPERVTVSNQLQLVIRRSCQWKKRSLVCNMLEIAKGGIYGHVQENYMKDLMNRPASFHSGPR